MTGSTNAVSDNDTKSTLIITVDAGSTVGAYTNAACTTLVKTATERSEGEFWITGLDNGLYYIKATKNTDESIVSYTINEFGVYRINISYRKVPEFTYTGDYEIVQDDDTVIDLTSYGGADWKIRFLTSGTLTFSDLKGANNGIDIFAVGGGSGGKTVSTNRGGGGAGGRTTLATDVHIDANTDYAISIGNGGVGGTSATAGGSTSGFGITAEGGTVSSSNYYGSDGGSGGGGSGNYTSKDYRGGSGGCDGSNGEQSPAGSNYLGGAGQGTTTREFGGYANTINTAVSNADTFVLSTEPTEVEKSFLAVGKYITLERSGVTRTGIQDVFPIVSYDDNTRAVTVDTTYQTVTASAGDTVKFGNLYAGGGAGSYTYANSPLCPVGGYGGGGNQSTEGTTNTGGGGGGNKYRYGQGTIAAAAGGSGIIIIRNAR